MSRTTTPADDLTLIAEVRARRRLGDRPLRLTVLAPYGAWIGCGVLRVLRVRERDAQTELVAGYDAYERVS